VALVEPNWKEEGIKNWPKVSDFLRSYRYSSYLDYIGIENFPSLTQRDPINSYFNSPEDYQKFVNSWLLEDNISIENLILD